MVGRAASQQYRSQNKTAGRQIQTKTLVPTTRQRSPSSGQWLSSSSSGSSWRGPHPLAAASTTASSPTAYSTNSQRQRRSTTGQQLAQAPLRCAVHQLKRQEGRLTFARPSRDKSILAAYASSNPDFSRQERSAASNFSRAPNHIWAGAAAWHSMAQHSTARHSTHLTSDPGG